MEKYDKYIPVSFLRGSNHAKLAWNFRHIISGYTHGWYGIHQVFNLVCTAGLSAGDEALLAEALSEESPTLKEVFLPMWASRDSLSFNPEG